MMRVGRFFISRSNQRKLARASWTPLLRMILDLILLAMASCMWLKRCLWSGIADGMERSAEDLVPLLYARAFLVDRDACEDCHPSFHLVLRQGDSHVDHVQDPPQDDFGGVPKVVFLDELFEQDDLSSEGAVAGVKWPEDLVDGMHEDLADSPALT